MSGADMLVQVLADEGVDTIFGYSGGAILPIYDSVFRYNQEHALAMPLIVPANEQGAGFMAAGYARASGRVGVALVTSGPGATNMVTPVRDCMADSIPIVVICGQVPTTAIGTDAFQEAPVPSIMGAVAKHVFLRSRVPGAPDRWCWMFPRTCKTARAYSRVRAGCRFPAIANA